MTFTRRTEEVVGKRLRRTEDGSVLLLLEVAA
jgi:hypothetical protein